MAKRVFQNPTWTPTATADNSAMANSTYMAIENSGTGAGMNVIEIYEGGQATASSVNIMLFARSLVFGSIPTALATPVGDGPMNSMTSALAAVPVTYVQAGTGPSRTNTALTARLNLSFNAFGGIVRWVAAPGEEWGISAISVSISGSTLSAFTGGSVGLMGSHIIYEPF